MKSIFRIRSCYLLMLTELLLSVASLDSVASLSTITFAEAWTGHRPVVTELAQIVYYRDASASKTYSGATVYIDGQYRTTLLPGGHTVFCLKPGAHSLGALLDQAPYYRGKNQGYQANFTGGKTYYLRVNEQGRTLPQQVPPVLGEQEMKQTYRQGQALNRSQSVEPCVYNELQQVTPQDFPLDLAQVVDMDMKVTDRGREALIKGLVELRQHFPRFRHLALLLPQVEPGADEVLANSLHQALIENAVPANAIVIQPQPGAEPPCGRVHDNRCFAPAGKIILRPDNNPD